MIANRVRIERQIDLGRQSAREAKVKLTNGATLLSPAVEAEAMSAMEDDSDLDIGPSRVRRFQHMQQAERDTDTSEQDQVGRSSQTSPMKARRKEIIRKLGISKANASEINDWQSQRKSETKSLTTARWRYSLGSLRLAERVREQGAGDVSNQQYSSTEDDGFSSN